MAEFNSSSLENVLNSVLSVAAQEKTSFYSPKVYSEHRNVIESLLLSSLVSRYPESQEVIDQIAPFVKVETILNKGGYVELPKDYRDLLGSPMIFANPSSNGECGSIEPLNEGNFQAGILKSGCNLTPVVIVPQSEFAYRTQSKYDAPSWKNPIGMFVEGNKIRVCPYDVSRVAVMYAKKERQLVYGYISQPDETYLYDPTTTIDTEFQSNAFEKIFNATMALYSAYSRNQELQSWSSFLLQKGIL